MIFSNIGIIASSRVILPPVNTVAPTISGTNVVGNVLTATNGTWTGASPITYTYQWRRAGVNIGSATSITYTLVQADAGSNIDCVVTGTNIGGSSTASSNSLLCYDSNAQAFITATGISGANSIALNDLVINLKSANIYTKFIALYPVIGGTSTTHKFNLINPLDTNGAFRLSFVGGWTHTSAGMLPNGTNAYADTFIAPNSQLTINNQHLSYYSRTSAMQSGTNYVAGSYNGGGSNVFALTISFNGNTAWSFINSTTANSYPILTHSNQQGFWMGNRTNATANTHKLWKNGINVGSTPNVTAGALLGNTIWLGALPNPPLAGYFGNAQCAFASIGSGLTDLESQIFYQIVEKYQVALGRNVNPIQSFYYNRDYNNETNAFLFSTQITDATIQIATNTLVNDLKSYNIWTKMKSIYPMVGGTATTHKYNLVDFKDTDAAYRLNFVGGWTHSSNGALPNGTNAYADTFLIPSTALSTTSLHFSYYSRTQVNASQYEMGAINLGISVQQSLALFESVTTKKNIVSGAYPTNWATSNDTNTQGLLIGSKIAANNLRLNWNGTTIATNTNSASTNVNLKIYIGAVNYTSLYYSTKECAFSSLGDGLTDVDMANLRTSVQSFQTTLGRQV